MSYWIAAKTKGSRERYAVENIERQGFNAYLPCTVSRRGRGMVLAVYKPIFASYVFVETEGPWRFLLGTYGVSGVVLMGDKPAIMPMRVLDLLRSQEHDGVIELPKYKQGSQVRVTAGVLQDKLGLYIGQTKNERIKVLMDILGGRRTITFAPEAIEAA